jgi:HEAT repeat protein
MRAIRRNLAGPGLQVAVAILGKLGNPRAIPLLEDLLRERSGISGEAALALGRLPSPASRQVLLEEMSYRSGSPLNRTCAAIALMDLDDVDASLPFLRAILLAGTPAGLPLQKELGLPDRARWAHERDLAIEAIGRLFDGETFGLDSDSPWPRLKAAVERMDAAASKLR